MITVLYGNKKILVPNSWDKLKPETIAIFVKEFFCQFDKLFQEDPETGKYYSKDVVAYDLVRTNLLQSIIGLSDAQFEKVGITQRHYLLNQKKMVEFIFNSEMNKPTEKTIGQFFKRFYGPKDFNKISAEEFSFADAACTNYIKTRNPKMLDTLVSILYRPKKTGWFWLKNASKSNGDIRQPFNKHLVDVRLKYVAKINEARKLAIFWWFHSQRARLPQKFPNVFTKGNSDSADKYGWLTVILSLGTNGPFGNYEATAATPFHMILTDLDAKTKKHHDKP